MTSSKKSLEDFEQGDHIGEGSFSSVGTTFPTKSETSLPRNPIRSWQSRNGRLGSDLPWKCWTNAKSSKRTRSNMWEWRRTFCIDWTIHSSFDCFSRFKMPAVCVIPSWSEWIRLEWKDNERRLCDGVGRTGRSVGNHSEGIASFVGVVKLSWNGSILSTMG